jgi:hypothetical protein
MGWAAGFDVPIFIVFPDLGEGVAGGAQRNPPPQDFEFFSLAAVLATRPRLSPRN